MNEAELRDLVARAVHSARHTTEGNMCEDAIVQHIMRDEFVDGCWQSMLFTEKAEA